MSLMLGTRKALLYGTERGRVPEWAVGMDMWSDFTRQDGMGVNDNHAQTIYAPNAAGVYVPFAPNEKVRTDLGLHTVPTRSNAIANNSMFGAAVGSPGTLPTGWSITSANGLVRDCVGLGNENGLPYIDFRIYGAGASNNPYVFTTGPNSQASVAPAQIWSASFGIKLLSVADGSAAPNFMGVRINEYDAGSAALSSQDLSNNISALGVFVRYERQVTIQANAATARMSIRFTTSVGVAYDFTVRIYAPQFELGAFASPPILTNGTALAVTGNREIIPGLTAQMQQGAVGFCQFQLLGLEPNSQFNLLFSDNSNVNRYGIFSSSTNTFSEVHSIAGTTNTRAIQAASNGLVMVVFAVAANYRRMGIVGGTVLAADTALGLPTLGQLNIGGLGHSANNNSYQQTRKLALNFLAPQEDPIVAFNDAFAKAQLAAAA